MRGNVELPLNVGDVVAGKYRIEGVLGRGGMATVFAAFHEELEQRVALKMLHVGMSSDPTHSKRFVAEARNAARIQSEHVARIMDVGRTEGDRVFIVMEYLEGSDLSRTLKLRGPLPVDEVVEHLVQACDAIAVAHSMGIVHRDLKPANLFLTHRVDGTACVKVLDFGIAKAFDQPAAREDITNTTAIVGSPLYMAPEQMASSHDVDRRADIWSLGIIAYRLLTRAHPFQGENIVELATAIATRPPRPLRENRPDISPALADAIMRCLERDPDARWPDVGAFVQAIAPYGTPQVMPLVQRVMRVARAPIEPPLMRSGAHSILEPEPSTITRSSTSHNGPLAPPSATSLAPPPEQVAPRRSGLVLWLGLFVVLGGAAAGIFFATVRNRGPQLELAEPAAKPAAQPAPSPSPRVEPVASASASASVAKEPEKPAAPVAAAPIAAVPVATAASIATKPVAKPAASGTPSKDVWGWGE